MSRATLAKLQPHLQDIDLPAQHVINEPGEEVEFAYFPHTGMISILAVLAEGAIETATIGREGGVNLFTGDELPLTLMRVTVQTPITAARIGAPQLRRLVQTHEDLRTLIVRANEALLAQVQIGAACNAVHSLQARLARWILQTKDRVDGDVLPLTHELLAQMMGVRRSSVSEIASQFRDDNLIAYSRGKLVIKNRAGLKRVACECYATIADNTASLLNR